MIMFGIPLNVVVRLEKYLASVKDDSAIICDKVRESHDERN